MCWGEICMFHCCCKPCSVMWTLWGRGCCAYLVATIFRSIESVIYAFCRFDFVFFFASGRPSSCSLLIFPHIKNIYIFFPLNFLCSWSSCRDNPRAMVIKKIKKLVKLNKTKQSRKYWKRIVNTHLNLFLDPVAIGFWLYDDSLCPALPRLLLPWLLGVSVDGKQLY